MALYAADINTGMQDPAWAAEYQRLLQQLSAENQTMGGNYAPDPRNLGTLDKLIASEASSYSAPLWDKNYDLQQLRNAQPEDFQQIADAHQTDVAYVSKLHDMANNFSMSGDNINIPQSGGLSPAAALRQNFPAPVSNNSSWFDKHGGQITLATIAAMAGGAYANAGSGTAAGAEGGTVGGATGGSTGYAAGSYDALEAGAYGTDAAAVTGGSGGTSLGTYASGAGTLGQGTVYGGGTTGGVTGGTGLSASAPNYLGASGGTGTMGSLVGTGAPVVEAGTMAGSSAPAASSTLPGSAGTGANVAAATPWYQNSNYLMPIASLASGYLNSNAIKDASSAQAEATKQATAEQQRQYDITRSDTAPWLQAGTSAVSRLSQLLGLSGGGDNNGSLNNKFSVSDFMNDPVTQASYKSGLDLGTQAIDRMSGARGSRNSGATLKELSRFGTDYTGQKAGESYNRFYGDQDRTFNRLAGVSGTGQTAVTNLGQIGSQTGTNIGNLMTSQGNARGAAAIAQGNVYGGAVQNIGNWYNQNQQLDKILASRNYGYTG